MNVWQRSHCPPFYRICFLIQIKLDGFVFKSPCFQTQLVIGILPIKMNLVLLEQTENRKNNEMINKQILMSSSAHVVADPRSALKRSFSEQLPPVVQSRLDGVIQGINHDPLENYYHKCVNNKMLEHDWLLTALIYALIGCFRYKQSDLTCPITNICNRTVKQPIKIKHFIPLANKLYLPSPP